jgi:periplasmic protein TonB
MSAVRKPQEPKARREPVLYAPVRHIARPQPALPGGRERLDTTFVPRPESCPRLRSVTTSMIRPQTIEEPGILAVLAVSSVLHVLLLLALIWASAHHAHGTPQGEPGPPVDMVFDTPPSRSGMRGPRSQDQGGGASPPKATEQTQSDQNQNETQSESRPTPAAPTPETPSAPPVPQAPSAELPQPTPEQRPVTPATPQSGRGTQSTTHAHHGARRRSQVASNNPFANMMDLSFDQSPAPTRRRHGRAGGSGGPIDMSLGPLVSNGQINAPYQTRNSVRGVSDDYGEEIDRWIRAHMYYPEDAARNGEEGPSSVHVVLDRSGHVKSVRMTGQSGSYSLDAATTGMFQGATLPPVPPDMKGDHFDIDLTIDYILIRR